MDKIKSFRLYDYNVYDGISKHSQEKNKYSQDSLDHYKDNKKFIIQAFGINDSNRTASILIEDFYPFFYIMVDEMWNIQRNTLFLAHLKKKVGYYYEDSIVDLKLVKRQKLYGFNNKKLHNFIKISFTNNNAFNKVKKIFYTDTYDKYAGFERSLNDEGYIYSDEYGTTNCYLYEADIPPLLKFFHKKQINPSGWIKISSNKVLKINNKTTHCAYEYSVKYEDICSYKEKETLVKYNICSFDIEASSSHGDFPVPIKSYKKLATNIVEYFEKKIKAVVSRGGRPDLALKALPMVTAPTLLIVGQLDVPVIQMNKQAFDQLHCIKEMKIIPGATHLFEEPGKLIEVAEMAISWYKEYFIK